MTKGGLLLPLNAADTYRSPSQRVRVATEAWVAGSLSCPARGVPRLRPQPNNTPAADFACPSCREEFELKGTGGRFGRSLPDGAYRTMVARVASGNGANLMLLQYGTSPMAVRNLEVIPRHFLVPGMVVARKPLAAQARRAGWVGCNIRLDLIPASGRIALVIDGCWQPAVTVLRSWHRTVFLREARDTMARGWLLDVLRCVDRIPEPEFELADLYSFDVELKRRYPDNNNIRPKIRQQVQRLISAGYLRRVEPGRYRKTTIQGLAG